MCGPIDRAPAEFGVKANLPYSLCGAGPRLDRLAATPRVSPGDCHSLLSFLTWGGELRTTRLVVLFIAALLAACTTAPFLDSPPSTLLENTPIPKPAAPTATRAVRPPLTGQLVFAAESSGRWNMNIANPIGGTWQRLTEDGSSRRPAVSRDGTRIAFESHRDGNWEIYVMDAAGTQTARLTRLAPFDGQPSWSPEGTQIAFASTRQGNLDIWLMNADGTGARDLTGDSPAVEDTPAWSPDGRWIAFTSWRNDRAQIFVASPDGKQLINLSQNGFDEQSPAWSPDGRQLAFVSDRDGQRGIYVADFSTAGLKNTRRLTFSGWDDFPTWSPDGKYLAFISPRSARQPIYMIPGSGGLSVALESDAMYVHSLAWANVAVGKPRATLPAAPLYPAPLLQTPASLIPLKDVYLAPSYGRMSDRVSGSFQALRARVRAEAGWDFLGVLSDMTRQLVGGPCGDGCDVMSWHKTGRAIDTRLMVESGGMSMLEIVREDQLGETYWRIYLRAAKQDGTLGEPLTQAPWDWTNTARWTLAPHQGGVIKPIPDGYYVDFTELAREYGWERISSYDDETFSWKEDKTGMEFWHYQNTTGTTWYAALDELYTSQTLAATFDWNGLQRQGEEAYRVRLKEVPAPPSAWRWFALFP